MQVDASSTYLGPVPCPCDLVPMGEKQEKEVFHEKRLMELDENYEEPLESKDLKSSEFSMEKADLKSPKVLSEDLDLNSPSFSMEPSMKKRKKHGSPTHRATLDYPQHPDQELGRGEPSLTGPTSEEDKLDLLDTKSKPSGHTEMASVIYEPENTLAGPLVPMEPMNMEENMSSMALQADLYNNMAVNNQQASSPPDSMLAGALVPVHTDMEEEISPIERQEAFLVDPSQYGADHSYPRLVWDSQARPVQREHGLLVDHGPSFPSRVHLLGIMGAREAGTLICNPTEAEQALVPMEPQAPSCEEEAPPPPYSLLDPMAITEDSLLPQACGEEESPEGRSFLPSGMDTHEPNWVQSSETIHAEQALTMENQLLPSPMPSHLSSQEHTRDEEESIGQEMGALPAPHYQFHHGEGQSWPLQSTGLQGDALVTEVDTMMEVDEEDTEKEALWREMENLYQQVLNFRQDLRQEVGERHQVCLRLEGRHMEEVHKMEGHLVRLEGLVGALEESKEAKGGEKALLEMQREKEKWDVTLQENWQRMQEWVMQRQEEWESGAARMREQDMQLHVQVMDEKCQTMMRRVEEDLLKPTQEMLMKKILDVARPIVTYVEGDSGGNPGVEKWLHSTQSRLEEIQNLVESQTHALSEVEKATEDLMSRVTLQDKRMAILSGQVGDEGKTLQQFGLKQACLGGAIQTTRTEGRDLSQRVGKLQGVVDQMRQEMEEGMAPKGENLEVEGLRKQIHMLTGVVQRQRHVLMALNRQPSGGQTPQDKQERGPCRPSVIQTPMGKQEGVGATPGPSGSGQRTLSTSMAVKTEPGTKKEGQDHRQDGESSSRAESRRSKRREKATSPLIPKKKRQALGDGPPEDPSSSSSEDSDSSRSEGGRRHPGPDPGDEGGGPTTRKSHGTTASTALRAGDFNFQSPMPSYTAARRYKMRETHSTGVVLRCWPFKLWHSNTILWRSSLPGARSGGRRRCRCTARR